ncbi:MULTISPECIES: sensor histidine kinase [Nitrospirillum]|uniref:histidine kinase n=1 Tax=Nitrospirillum amazonense TaxID=28077 RepID=A0A560GAT3_9PROT|nr:sensor histidine kinase KdpD [Nitrospirillum amazonense]MEC4590641.1 sensor histidine kinase KdpD [Nitrospirillum amazonense]TWB30820.1 two-component system sensor histidine kinase KdpD [Nitrospirillum amazonense]
MTNADYTNRPSPDALLSQAMQERRGKLRIYLGAAPGVGKTYQMLETARQLKAEGVDVVVGVVETHGRRETEAMVAGLEVVPRRVLEYKGRTLEEMDIDALLRRRPRLALVDELAHTNAAGSRHAKRYSDVEELLAAGIDVLTTLNIQHVESLNDVVAQITRIRVRETVPDSVLEMADEIEVIDLPPQDLIKRLNEGKVYIREQAQRALKHYFSPGNLTALRELALRRTAQRVDDQMLSYMQRHAIQGPWAAGDRVLVCVSEDRTAGGLVRYAKRLADRLKTRFTALYVETARTQRLTEAARDRIADTLRLAEQLGGEAITVPGRTIAADVLGYARANNFTHIIIGKSERPRWFEIVHGSVVHELVRKAGTISVHVIAGDAVEADEIPPKMVRTRPESSGLAWQPYGVATLMVGLATVVSTLLGNTMDVRNLSLVYIAAVLASAILHGYGPSLFASCLSVLAYNFFFLPPLYTFTIRDPSNVVALVFFTIVAVFTSRLTARVREQATIAANRARITAQMFSFARKLAGIGEMEDLLWATTHQVALLLKVRVVLLMPDDHGALEVRAGYPPEDQVGEMDLAAARWAYDNAKPAGRGAPTLPGTQRLFLPVRTERGVVAVVGVDTDDPGPILTPDQRRLLDAIMDQAAVAIERVKLVQDIDKARLEGETERLRSAMLTSLSHDLRTPLAAIIGTATTLKSEGEGLEPATRAQLTGDLLVEAERMGRFVRNLLDMTRLEAGLDIRREPTDLVDVVHTATQRAKPILAGRPLDLDLAADLPLVRTDYLLLEQVLFNLLDNAAKYSGPEGRVGVSAARRHNHVVIRVMDEGVGIPPDSLERIFDKFYRVEARDHRQAGTGLGLAICRGFMTALGGTIKAANRTDKTGAVFELTLPTDDALDAWMLE